MDTTPLPPPRARRPPILAAFVLAAGALPPGLADPLRSPACLQALAALTAAEDRAIGAAPRDADREALTAARRGVALACLGSPDLRPPAARARAPLEVGSALPALPSVATPRAAAPGRSAPVPTAPPLVTLGACDAAGCWASDGTRLQRQGSLLLGPRGYCSLVGTVLSCP